MPATTAFVVRPRRASRGATETRKATAKEFARLVGRSQTAVYSYVDRSIIPATRLGGRISIDPVAARDALAANLRPPGRPRKAEVPQEAGGPVAAEAVAAPEIPRRKRGRPVCPEARLFNASLARLIQDDGLAVGEVAALLARVTGLSYEAVRERIDEVEHEFDEPERTGQPEGGITRGDRQYLLGRYGRMKNRGVQEWLASIRRPDGRRR